MTTAFDRSVSTKPCCSRLCSITSSQLVERISNECEYLQCSPYLHVEKRKKPLHVPLFDKEDDECEKDKREKAVNKRLRGRSEEFHCKRDKHSSADKLSEPIVDDSRRFFRVKEGVDFEESISKIKHPKIFLKI